eukprot:763754-Hanusia_phi.AAC.2
MQASGAREEEPRCKEETRTGCDPPTAGSMSRRCDVSSMLCHRRRRRGSRAASARQRKEQKWTDRGLRGYRR